MVVSGPPQSPRTGLALTDLQQVGKKAKFIGLHLRTIHKMPSNSIHFIPYPLFTDKFRLLFGHDQFDQWRNWRWSHFGVGHRQQWLWKLVRF
jgi:hypothetical protein